MLIEKDLGAVRGGGGESDGQRGQWAPRPYHGPLSALSLHDNEAHERRLNQARLTHLFEQAKTI